MKKSFQSFQGGRPLLEYYNELNSIFLELDYHRPNDMECVNDIEKLRKHTAKDRIYIFHANLNHHLDQVSGWIFAYSQVRREEQRQFTMRIEDRLETLALTIQRTTLIQHLLFVLLTIFLVSALTVIAQDIPKMFVGRSMAIQSG